MSYPVAGSLGDMRDALALIRAAIDDDDEAAAVILDHADLRALAATLADYAAAATMAGNGGREGACGWLAEAQRYMTEAEREGGTP